MPNVNVDRAFCQLFGNCVAVAPNVFWFDDSGELEYRKDIENGEISLAQDASASCPMGAIEVGE